VIYHGINHSIFKIYDDLKLPFELPKKFIFSVGSIEPRKNLLGLLRAYNDLSEQTRFEYKLVLAGFKGWENKEIMELITKNKQNIHYLGFIDDSELAKVYNLASLFVFPSFYEGFGLPPLEAMACGTPVVSSNLTSMPEVCQDAAIYCDPYDIVDIKQKIELVLGDETIQKELINKGLKRASEFSWQKSAQSHLAVFKEVIES
jgi:glycosyltransferase involved in cell wall biosynthesis